MTPMQSLASIAVMALVTFLTRAIPFLLFDHGKQPPRLVLKLSEILPPAIMAMLIIYCLKDLTFTAAVGFVPALLAVAVVVLLQLLRRNDLLSILGGTAVYMLLLQLFS